MRHGSLFSGIGGFDLASEWMGWDNVFHCEWNEFGSKVLKHYWPKAISYADITKTDFTIHRGNIDILTGGFPCQPYSAAGKRLGTADDRHLWPEMLRAIREIQPTFVVGENVRGLTNWNGGLVFDQVQADLEAEGYEVTPFLLPACAVNAPHRRDRIWFVAYNEGAGWNQGNRSEINNEGRKVGEYGQKRNSFRDDIGTSCNPSRPTPNPNHPGAGEPMRPDRIRSEENEGREGFAQPESGQIGGDDSNSKCSNMENKFYEQGCMGQKDSGWKTVGFKYGNIPTNWDSFPTSKPTICSGNDGIPNKLDGITFPKWRNESIKGYGNAIVPQVAYQIFKAIELTMSKL